jgi:cation transporter-like permease
MPQLTLLNLFLIVLGLGVLAWLINRAPFIDAPFKQILVYGLLVLAVIAVLAFFGVWRAISSFHF